MNPPPPVETEPAVLIIAVALAPGGPLGLQSDAMFPGSMVPGGPIQVYVVPGMTESFVSAKTGRYLGAALDP